VSLLAFLEEHPKDGSPAPHQKCSADKTESKLTVGGN